MKNYMRTLIIDQKGNFAWFAEVHVLSFAYAVAPNVRRDTSDRIPDVVSAQAVAFVPFL